MKRIVPLVVAGIVTISSIGSLNSYANPGKGNAYGHQKNNNKLPYGIAKKINFTDCDVVDWAKDAIEYMAEKGYISGVGDGLFLPKNSLTKIEAIAMALRITGYTDEATKRTEEIINGNRELSNKHLVSQWAYGYLDLALQRGILKEDELRDFKNNEPAKRIDLVKYVIRALGLEDEAEDNNDKDLDYADKKAIKKDLTGYAYLAKKLNIMTGYPDNTFQPNRSVTRAQMAVLMEKVDYLLENDLLDDIEKDDDKKENNEYTGIVTSVSSNRIKVEIDDDIKTFYINSKTDIENENGDEKSYKNINEGDKVTIKVDKHNIATDIEIKDPKIDVDFKGIITEINIDDDEEGYLVINDDNDYKVYEVDEDIVVWLDGKKSSIEKLKEGDKVSVELDDDEIIYIDATSSKKISYEVKGIVKYVDDDDEIGIDISNVLKRYEFDDDVKVTFKDGAEADIADIVIGGYVNLVIEKNDDDDYEVKEVIINKSSSIRDFSASFVKLYDKDKYIQVKYDGRVKTYELAKDVEVRFRDGSKAELSDLDKNDFIYLSVDRNQEIVKIIFNKNERTESREGKLVEYTNNKDNKYMLIKDKSTGDLKVYELDKDVEVYIDGKSESLSDLDQDDDVIYKINSKNKIIEVRVID